MKKRGGCLINGGKREARKRGVTFSSSQILKKKGVGSIKGSGSGGVGREEGKRHVRRVKERTVAGTELALDLLPKGSERCKK